MMNRTRHAVAVAGCWLLLAALTAWAYWPGLSGPPVLDDRVNLAPLQSIEDSADYFADLVATSRDLHLAIQHGTATIAPSLTPFKERETLVFAAQMDRDLQQAVYHVLQTFVSRLGVQSFNLALYQPPLSDTPEDWQGFPFVVRVLDRGSLQSTTSDIGELKTKLKDVATINLAKIVTVFLKAHPPVFRFRAGFNRFH